MRVLISGAGIAGPTLAYLLARNGFHPTVVERSTSPRSSGSPVDVRGAAVSVADRLGVAERIREAGTAATALSFVNDAGRRVAQIPLRTFATGGRDVELPRGDLAAILYEAGRYDAEYLFNDTIVSLAQDEDGVDVTFARAEPRRFDLVVGADGLHSAVRRLAFGPEHAFVRHMGVFVATLPLPFPPENQHEILHYNMPGRAATIHPGRGKGLAAFMFRSPMWMDFDYRDVEQHKRRLIEAYAGAGWVVPDILSGVSNTVDLYFDSVSRVRLPHWSRGRVTLVGDAATCVSLFGDGSSSAMTGAATLAGALSAHGHDHRTALTRYESAQRRVTNPKQRNVSYAARLLIPATRTGIATRNTAARLISLVRR